jgi:hypothetical protein
VRLGTSGSPTGPALAIAGDAERAIGPFAQTLVPAKRARSCVEAGQSHDRRRTTGGHAQAVSAGIAGNPVQREAAVDISAPARRGCAGAEMSKTTNSNVLSTGMIHHFPTSHGRPQNNARGCSSASVGVSVGDSLSSPEAREKPQ